MVAQQKPETTELPRLVSVLLVVKYDFVFGVVRFQGSIIIHTPWARTDRA